MQMNGNNQSSKGNSGKLLNRKSKIKFKENKMRRRIKNAAEQYDKKFGKSKRGQFYLSDLYEIEEETGLNPWDSISMALRAGFMIGYRCKR